MLKEKDALSGIMIQVAEPPLSPRRAVEKQKYYTLGHQKKKQNPAVDFSTLNKGTYASTRPRGALMQVLFNQGSSEKIDITEERGSSGGNQEQVEALKQVLESFSVPAELSWKWGGGGRSEVLEKSWTDIVHSHESMTKDQRHQQEALWELLHTELVYINQLTIITKLVLGALDYVHQHGFLNEVTATELFTHLPSVLQAHQVFWKDVLYPMLLNARLTGRPFDPLMLESGFLRISDRFSAYLDYCWRQEKNMEFTRTQMEANLHFSIFLQWVESHPYCGRMRMGDMQAKPHQRITKYPLLLKAIQKSTQDLQTQCTVKCMLNSVSQFLEMLNNYLQIRDDKLALLALSQKIEGYELVGINEEIDNYIQEFCRFDLTSSIRGMGPDVIRKLIMEETLKVRGRKDSKLEGVMLLFTDVLLFTKTHKKSEKQKVVHPPLSLERIQCVPLKDGYSFVLAEMSDVGCAVNVYSVTAPSPDSCTAWISAIHQAQETLETLRESEALTQMESELINFNYRVLDDEAAQEPPESLSEDRDKRLERRVTWNHKPKSRKNSSDASRHELSSPGGDVPEEPVHGDSPCTSKSSPVTDSPWRDSGLIRDSEASAIPSESQAFPRIKLQRKRFMSSQSSALHDNENGQSYTGSDINGASSDAYSKPQDLLVVPSIGSLNQNGQEFWDDLPERTSPVPQILSDPEVAEDTCDQNSFNPLLLETQINGSVSNVLAASPGMLGPATRRREPDLSVSPLQGSLLRALQREKERKLLRQQQEPVGNVSPVPTVPEHPVPSPSLRGEEQESDGEELELFKARMIFYSGLEMEISVDETVIEDVERPNTPQGVSVDWPDLDEDDESLDTDERSVLV